MQLLEGGKFWSVWSQCGPGSNQINVILLRKVNFKIASSEPVHQLPAWPVPIVRNRIMNFIGLVFILWMRRSKRPRYLDVRANHSAQNRMCRVIPSDRSDELHAADERACGGIDGAHIARVSSKSVLRRGRERERYVNVVDRFFVLFDWLMVFCVNSQFII